jgi:hypothetical protein
MYGCDEIKEMFAPFEKTEANFKHIKRPPMSGDVHRLLNRATTYQYLGSFLGLLAEVCRKLLNDNEPPEKYLDFKKIKEFEDRALRQAVAGI